MNVASRLLHGLCAGALFLSLTACGGGDGGSAGVSPTPPGPTEPEKPAEPTPSPNLRCAP